MRTLRSASPVTTANRWRGRAVFLGVGFVLLVVAPALLSDFRLGLLAKYLCFAIAAVGIDLAWGYGGMLTLGQGVFFGLGGYAMGMFLKLQEAGPGGLPDFMSYNGLTEVPLLWRPFSNSWVALPAVLLLPMLLAAGLGALIFRQRIRGAYFAILTQVLAVAFVTLLIGQQGFTAGTNGLTNMRELFGYDLNDPTNQRSLYFLVALVLAGVYLLARQLVHSRYGRLLIAVRDGEDRVRFLGYNPTIVKVIAFTVSAGMAGLAGALFVPVVGIMSPALLGIVPSLELLIGVAVGGRATLVGAVLGTVLINYAKTGLSEQFASGWLYLQGALFITVVAFAPKGIAGLREAWSEMRQARRRIDAPAVEPASAPATEAPTTLEPAT